MILRKWEDLPDFMRVPEVRPYWEILNKKRWQLSIKRCFDIIMSLVLLIILVIPMLIIALMIKIDSKGPVFYRQERVTTYGKHFRIFKLRSMVNGAENKGSLVTVGNDSRITRVGRLIRKLRLDEISQLIDVFRGTMTFVGTRPEVPKYVRQYKPEYLATLLLPAGVTSMASIMFKDEDSLLEGEKNVDQTYVDEVLPEKMKWNLSELKKYSLGRDIKIMFKTISVVFCCNNKGEEKKK